jgi:hypothetical protein
MAATAGPDALLTFFAAAFRLASAVWTPVFA